MNKKCSYCYYQIYIKSNLQICDLSGHKISQNSYCKMWTYSNKINILNI